MEYYTLDCSCKFPITRQVDNSPSINLDIESVPLTCNRTWRLISEGLTKGVFQLESPLGRQWTKKLKPENIEQLAALTALLRPGCLRAIDDNGISMTEHYCLRKNKEEPVEYFHSSLIPILQSTYGVLAYQEQAMQIAQAIAGFNLQTADELRKAIGKKLPEEMAKVKIKFIEGVEKAGIVSADEGAKIFSWIEAAQRYSFNKCVSGDTVIKKMHKGKSNCNLTVAEMYHIRNSIAYAKTTGHLSLYKKYKLNGHFGSALSLCSDNRVRPNIIADITYAGKHVVYRIITKSGKYIDVTSNHRFPTTDGIFTATELMGKELLICGEYEKSDFKFSNFTIEDIREKHKQTTIHGNSEPGFLTGAYTEYCTNIEKLPNYCQLCGRSGCRLEVHHMDGDRTHNSIDNLCRLCVSCHKKEEYKADRTKVGEKGYPIITEKVLHIVAKEVVDTYDVTMAAPHHTFVANGGIITCNSHAVCYAMNGYWSAYCKAHFPVQFFASWLKHAGHKQDPKKEVRELINEAKLMSVEVLPPDITNVQSNFHTDGKIITFGLTNIKGIGVNLVKKIQSAIISGEEVHQAKISQWSWLQLLTTIGPVESIPNRIGMTPLKNMIAVGALRQFDSNRSKLIEELRIWDELTKGEALFIVEHARNYTNLAEALQKASLLKRNGGGCHDERRQKIVQSLADSLEHPATKIEDSANWIAGSEEMLLGTSITCSRIDDCDISAINCTCRDFVDGNIKNLTSIMLGVEIQTVKELKTRKGKAVGSKMARLTISDGTCAVEAICWPEVYKEISYLLTEKNTLIVQGYRDRKQGTFIIQKVWQTELLALDE